MTPVRRSIRRGKGSRRRSAISLTPLVDVVFILVIFFMVASSFTRTNTIGLEPPSSPSGRASVSVGDLSVLHVLGDGHYELDGRAFDSVELTARLAEFSGARLAIRSSEAAVLQDVVRVLDVTNRLGIDGIALSVPTAPAVGKEK